MNAVYSFGTALVAALVLTPAAAAVALRLGVIDEPGGHKGHAKATPLLGGVAIAAAIAVAAAIAGVAARFAVILGAAAGVFLVGLLDDCRGTPVWLRLLVQTCAALAVVWSGTRATFLVGHAWITVPVTVLWIVGITNAFNLLDNMDGLSAGVAGIAAAMFLLVCHETGQAAEAAALSAVAGAAAGFLPYNFKPARVFMGDAGALTLGFVIACLSVSMTFYKYEGTALPLAAPLLVLAIPLFDTASVLWIRIRRGTPLTRGDRNHFSHRLVALGMGERTAVVTIYMAATAIGLGAVLLKDLSWWGGGLLLVQAALVLGIVVLMETTGKGKSADDH